MSIIRRFFSELRRRQVLGVAIIYIGSAWVLIQVATVEVISDAVGIDPRLILIVAVSGFPIALVAGWFYDITNRGVFRTAPSSSEDTFDTRLQARDFGLLAGLAVVWAGLVYLAYVPPATDKSLAILPFENRSYDPESSVFAYGVRSDLQIHLQRIHDLRVAAYESAEKVDQDLPIEQIASRLGVAYLLKGSVDRIADRIRVNVSLIDARAGSQPWSGSYDRELSTTGLFSIRSDIAFAITDALQTALSEEERDALAARPTEVFAAWEAYLFGEQRLASATVESVEDAVRYFRESIELDPNLAEAYVGLANSYHRHEMLSGQTMGNRDPETDPKVAAAVNQALQLNSQLGSAHAALADIKFHQLDFDGMQEQFERAIALSPNDASIYFVYGNNIANRNPEKSLRLLQTAIELNPLSGDVRSALARTLGILNRPAEALEQYCKGIELNPRFARMYFLGALTHAFQMGNVDEAVRWSRKAISEDPQSGAYWHMLGYFYFALGDDSAAIEAAERYFSLSPDLLKSITGLLHLYLHTGPNRHEQELLDKLNELFPDHPDTLDIQFRYLMRDEQHAEARDLIQQFHPDLTPAEPPVIDDENEHAATMLAMVFKQSGDEQQANDLLDAVLEHFRSKRERLGIGSLLDGELIALAWRGNIEEALQGSKLVAEETDALFWWRQNFEEPFVLNPLYDQPEFESMRADLRVEAARQLARVHEWEETGVLESIPCP